MFFNSRLKGFQAEGDIGGRVIIESMRDSVKFLAIDDATIGLDIDSEDEYARLK